MATMTAAAMSDEGEPHQRIDGSIDDGVDEDPGIVPPGAW